MSQVDRRLRDVAANCAGLWMPRMHGSARGEF